MVQKYIIDKADIHDLLTGKDIPLEQGNKARAFCVEIAGGLTNGEVMQAVYADSEICIDETWKTVTVYLGADGDYCEDEVRFDLDWWNAPYKAESEGQVN